VERKPAPPDAAAVSRALKAIEKIVGRDAIFATAEDRDAYSDKFPVDTTRHKPAAAVAPTSTEQVQAMQVDFARRMGLRDLSQLPQTDAMEEPARRRVATGLIVSELLRAENLKLDREYVNRRLTEATGEGPGSDELRRQYLQNVEAMRQIESLALEDQLVDFVVERAKVLDKPSSFSELTGFGRNPTA